jgi:single-strand DNA-binding protein
MRSLNQCNFIGNLGKEPESRTTPGGATVCNFSIAVSDDFTKDGQKVEATEWVRVVAFGKLAEICGQYLKKGSKVFVTGRFKTRSWEQDGVKRYTTEIVASEMQMLDSRSSDTSPHQSAAQPQASSQPQAAPSNFDDFDDIPFN